MRKGFDSGDIKLGGSVGSRRAMNVRELFEKYYDNKIAVISLDQQGDYGKVVTVAANVDLTGMNAKTLRFYSFDAATNKFIFLNPQPRFWIGEDKYLRFDTFFAGDIIITDKALKRK